MQIQREKRAGGDSVGRSVANLLTEQLIRSRRALLETGGLKYAIIFIGIEMAPLKISRAI